MSCNKGIYRVKKQEVEEVCDSKRKILTCQAYGKIDGMFVEECNGGYQSAARKSRDGRLWFATVGGAAIVNPNALPFNDHTPNVLVEQALADSKRVGGTDPFMVGDSSVVLRVQSSSQFPNNVPLQLAASTGKLEFHYTATSLAIPERVKFKYFMEGYDIDWTYAGTRRSAYYTNLPRGRSYRFRVIACNNDGVWNEAGAWVEFDIAPFWWETWWFRLFAVMFIVGGVYQSVRWRIQRLHARTQELERIVAERTKELRSANEEISRQMDILTEQAGAIELSNTTLQEKNELLETLNVEKSELMGIVSHDLKNPIGAIRGFSELILQDFVEGEQVKDMMRHIVSTSDRMLDLVKNLLDMNRLEEGGMQMNNVTFDIVPQVENTVWQYQTPAEAKNIRLHCSNEAEITTVFADEQAIMQVLDNLVSNAVKYSPHGKQVFVRVVGDTQAVQIEIQDEGPGISEEDMKKLFGKFARLSAQPTGGEHSTGLGLSIVKKMVEAMNGRVWCESEIGNGAKFVVRLPAVSVAFDEFGE